MTARAITPPVPDPPPALPGTAEAVLHQQLFRYASDLHDMVERHRRLEDVCQSLRASIDELSRARQDDGDARLAYLAHHDGLTGLPNRGLLQDRLGQLLAHGRRNRRAFTLLFLDLDGFKAINDELGHEAGDHLLSTLAQRLQLQVREGDTVARMGGDEFVVLAPGLSGARQVTRYAAKLIDSVVEPVAHPLRAMSVGVSVGSVEFPLDGQDAGALLRKADAAMYRAKALGGSAHVRYETLSGADGAAAAGPLAEELAAAVAGNRLMLRFEPCFVSGAAAHGGWLEPAGAVVSPHWQHPTLGEIAPEHFMPLAERCGAIVALGRAMLQAACAQLAVWRRAGWPDLTLSVPLSGRELREADLPGAVRAALLANGLPPDALTLVLPEQVLGSAAEPLDGRLDALAALGVGLVAGRFGRGDCNVPRLRQLPLRGLDLDGERVRALDGSAAGEAVCRGLLALAQALALTVTADGVERREQLQRLQQMGCRRFRGPLLGRAMTVEDFDAWLAQR